MPVCVVKVLTTPALDAGTVMTGVVSCTMICSCSPMAGSVIFTYRTEASELSMPERVRALIAKRYTSGSPAVVSIGLLVSTPSCNGLMAAHSSVPTAAFLNRITAPARSGGGVVVV